MTPVRQALALLPMVSLLGLVATPSALAAGWQVDARWRAGAEVDDGGAGTRTSATAGATLGVRRETETASTQADAVLNLRSDAGAARRSSDGRLALVQSIVFERDRFSAEAGIASEALVDAPLGTADVLLGRGDRRTRRASLGWNHRFDERLSAQLSTSREASDYADTAVQASDFGEHGVGASVSYALDERTQVSVIAGRSGFRSEDGTSRSDSDSLRLSWSHQWSETSSVSASVGAWRSTRVLGFDVFVCPVAAGFCEAGVVDYVAVRRTASARSSGSSYAFDLDRRLDERSGLVAKLSRDLQTGGAGVQRIDAASLGLRRAFTPQLDGSLTLATDRSSAVAGGSAGVRQRSATLGLRRALSADSSVSLSLDARRASSDRSDGAALRSTRLSVVYESAGPGLNR